MFKLRLRHRRRQHVFAVASSRQSMQGISHADVDFTLERFRTMDPAAQGFVRYALNGSFYTKDKLIHSGVVENTLCPWYGEEDSVLHRHWFCTHTQDLRAQLSPSLLEALGTLPACTLQHGFTCHLLGQNFNRCFVRSQIALACSHLYRWKPKS